MRVHITNIYGYIGTGAKAQNDVTKIAKSDLQYEELGVYRYPVESDTSEMLRTRLDGVLASISDGDVVIMQSPTWNDMMFDEKLMDSLSCYRIKKVIFIHDVLPLMFESWRGSLKRYIDFYNRADLVIVASQNMADRLYMEGLKVKKIVVHRMFDSVVSIDDAIKPELRKRINFVGNIDDGNKTIFVKEWSYDKVQLSVTADNGSWADGKNVNFMGWYNNDNLLANALRRSGGFGLLWSEDVYWHEYIKINASYKLSTYLAAGIPVIVPNGIAEQDMIIRKNLGIVVDSLDEAVERTEHISEWEYRQMVDGVERFAYLLREGYFTKKALTDAVFQLFND